MVEKIDREIILRKCRYFNQDRCKLGKNCKFRHVKSVSGMFNEFTSICVDYKKTGSCSNGDGCLYIHEQTGNEERYLNFLKNSNKRKNTNDNKRDYLNKKEPKRNCMKNLNYNFINKYINLDVDIELNSIEQRIILENSTYETSKSLLEARKIRNEIKDFQNEAIKLCYQSEKNNIEAMKMKSEAETIKAEAIKIKSEAIETMHKAIKMKHETEKI